MFSMLNRLSVTMELKCHANFLKKKKKKNEERVHLLYIDILDVPAFPTPKRIKYIK